jgi:hypothetical protein
MSSPQTYEQALHEIGRLVSRIAEMQELLDLAKNQISLAYAIGRCDEAEHPAPTNEPPSEPLAQEPVARLHITETDDWPEIKVEVLNGELLQPSMSPVSVFVTPHTAEVDQLLEQIKAALRDAARYGAGDWQHLIDAIDTATKGEGK